MKKLGKYFIEKEWYSKSLGCCVSYESGALDDKYFETEEEATKYACQNLYRLTEDNAVFTINLVYEEDEDNFEYEYITTITKD